MQNGSREAYARFCDIKNTIKDSDIFATETEELLKQADQSLLEALSAPILSRVDAYNVLCAVMAAGSYERPVRRALMHLAQFLGAH